MAARKIIYKGEAFSSIAALAARLNLSVYVLRDRIRQQWPEEKWAEPQKLKEHSNETLDALIQERQLMFARVGDIVDTKTPIKFCCLSHNEVHPAAPSNILQGHGLKCCYREAMEREGRKKRDDVARVYDERLAKKNPSVVRLEKYIGRDTSIWHLCTKHWEWRRALPGSVLSGHGLKCCLIDSNNKRTRVKRDKAGEQYLEYLKTYAGGNFSLVGEYLGRNHLSDHHCVRHDSTLKTRPGSLLGGQTMMCCWDAVMAEQGQKRIAKAAQDFVQRLEQANPDVELVGEYLGTNTKTLFRCKKHCETYLSDPKGRLHGRGLHCCHVANGKAMGRLTGPLNGWGGDSVWEVLAGRSTRHESTILYLFDSPDTPLLKYGITSDGLEKRRRRSWLPGVTAVRYGELLIKPRIYLNRDQAVLIEGAYQFSYGFDASKKLGIGWTELTDVSPQEFLDYIHELEAALLELGPWDFAEEYCDPVQVEKAHAVTLRW